MLVYECSVYAIMMINDSLNQWREAWIHHKLRTTGKTPLEMYSDDLKAVSNKLIK